MTWLTGWLYRQQHIITAGVGASDNFQIPITIHYSAGASTDGDMYCDSLCKTDFGDIRFTSADGETLLDYWVYSKVDSDNAVIWFEVAGDLNSDRVIYIYYGNNAAVSASSQANTFVDVLTGVEAAYPMEEAAGATVVDESDHGNDATATGTTIVDGKFAGKKARSFNGASDLITVTDADQLDIVNPTVMVYAKLNVGGAYQQIFSKYGINGYSGVYSLRVNDTDRVYSVVSIGGVAYAHMTDSIEVLTTTAFKHVCMTHNGSTLTSYLEGVVSAIVATVAVGNVTASDENLIIGRREITTDPSEMWLNGVLCNLIILSVTPTATQILNCANNYPDATLDVGKILVRKYATTTQPSHGSWAGVGGPDIYTVSSSTGGSTVPTGEQIVNADLVVTATANAGYRFNYWLLDAVNVGGTNLYTIVFVSNESHTLQAVFIQQFILTVNSSTGGTTDVVGANVYDIGTVVTVTATVTAGTNYFLANWVFDGVNIQLVNPYTATMDSAHTLTPVFWNRKQLLIDIIAKMEGYRGIETVFTSGTTVSGWDNFKSPLREIIKNLEK